MEEKKLTERAWEIIKRDWKSIPNFLSYLRFALIPVFVWLYVARKAYMWAAVVVIASFITDVLDGWVARTFHMTTEMGQILDPVADKATQITMFLCLVSRYKLAIPLVLIMVAKEITVGAIGVKLFRDTGKVEKAKWFGKITTFVIVAVAFALVLWFEIPANTADILLWIAIAFASFGFIMYVISLLKEIKEAKKG
jgi:cardiolipin synthase